MMSWRPSLKDHCPFSGDQFQRITRLLQTQEKYAHIKKNCNSLRPWLRINCLFDLARSQNNFGSIGWLGDNLTKEFNHNQKVLTDSIQEANTDLGQSY